MDKQNAEYQVTVLTSDDQAGIEFCVSYLTKAWKQTREESLARITECVRRDEGNLCIVCKSGTQPIGMVLFRKGTGLKLPHPIYYWIQGLYVADEFRNSPAVLKIFLLLRKTLKAEGVKEIHLGVDPHVPKLKTSYLAMGFKELGVKSSAIGHVYDILQMKL
jgi:hypothetical protein